MRRFQPPFALKARKKRAKNGLVRRQMKKKLFIRKAACGQQAGHTLRAACPMHHLRIAALAGASFLGVLL